MDELAKYNQERWSELVTAGVEYTKPFTDFDRDKATAYLDRWSDINRLQLDFAGKDVLCLASGGGQQTVCFSLLGAKSVTVIDLTPGQLEQDAAMATQYGYSIHIEHGDMRDLSCFADDSFDVVYQAYSINFVPDPLPVLAEVSRVIRPDGLYYLQFGNPLWNMDETDWTEKGYPIRQPYVQGQPSTPDESPWDVHQPDGTSIKVDGPKEFTHTMGTLVNGLGDNGFMIFAMVEVPEGDATAEPGSWEHFLAYLPLWPAVWSKKTS